MFAALKGSFPQFQTGVLHATRITQGLTFREELSNIIAQSAVGKDSENDICIAMIVLGNDSFLLLSQ